MSFLTGATQLLTGVAGATAAFGQVQQGRQAAAAADYNSAVYSQQAELIERSAALEKAKMVKQKASYLSSMRAAYSFRGVKLEGTPLLALADSASNLELDIQTTEFNALLDANRARSGAEMYGLQARSYRMAGYMNAGATLINTGSKLGEFQPKPKKKLLLEP